MSLYPGAVPVDDVHRWKTEATQRLLGYTIALTEDEWHQPSLLPGWTRAHIATHLARNADYLRSVVNAAVAGAPQPALASSAERRAELELGADRRGLALQIDLDAASGALQNAIESVTDWTGTITVDGADLPLSVLPLIRLNEIKMHVIDLDCGFAPEMIAPQPAEWLLRWALFRLREADLPPIEVTSPNLRARVGVGTGQPLSVRGDDAHLWAWLTGRTDASALTGAPDGRLPLLH